MFQSYNSRKSDEYYTPKWVWEAIAPYLPKDKVIWEAFGIGSSISSSQNLRDLGFQVVQTEKDFFLENKGDYIISNPPFSQIKRVFERIVLLDKPFCLIINSCCLHSKYFKDIFKDSLDEIQLFIPPKIDYLIKNPETNEMEFGKKGCPYYSLIICWKMKMKKDVVFISKIK